MENHVVSPETCHFISPSFCSKGDYCVLLENDTFGIKSVKSLHIFAVGKLMLAGDALCICILH